MAKFIPSLDIIDKFKVPPTDGERTLLNFLRNTLDDSYEVYFNPYLNGDRPDVIIIRPYYGVMIIEVKDWNLTNFRLDDKKRWIYTPNQSPVKSPINQVIKYKENLFDLHVQDLLKMKIQSIKSFNIVSCAVYFHCSSQAEVDGLLVNPFKNDNKYQTFLKYNIDLIGRDSLNKENFTKIFKSRCIINGISSAYFTRSIYENFKRLLAPPLHLKEQGQAYLYTKKQKEIIYSQTLEQRVKGVFGSGKTTVLAARAVQAYKRALNHTHNPRILILTYNITLT